MKTATVKLEGAKKLGVQIKVDTRLDKKHGEGSSFPKKLESAKEILHKLKKA